VRILWFPEARIGGGKRSGRITSLIETGAAQIYYLIAAQLKEDSCFELAPAVGSLVGSGQRGEAAAVGETCRDDAWWAVGAGGVRA
jgi:hypothetical protein